MLAPILATLLAAVIPRAPAEADLVIHAPRLDRLKGITAFFTAAGARAPLLAPSKWRAHFLPLVEADISHPESLIRSGVDPASPATLSYLGDDRITCAMLLNPKAFEEKASRTLGTLGQNWTGTARGAALRGALSGQNLIAGYALRGKQVCAVSSARNGEALLRDASALLGPPDSTERWKGLDSLPGHLYVILRHFAMGLTGERTKLSLVGRATGVSSARLKPSGVSPYRRPTPSTILYLRARLENPARSAIASVPDLEALCPSCDPRELADFVNAAAGSLTGNVLLRVNGARLSGPLKTRTDRYFAVKNAYLAELSQAQGIKTALEGAAHWRNARKTDDGIALSTAGGEVRVGVRGSQLYVGNDRPAIERAFESLSGRKEPLTHGAEFSIDPRQVGRALSSISLLDALASRELAPLLAVSAELGPLLDTSSSASGWADTAPDGSPRFALTWTLLP
jgi:hypothetical protein